MYCIAEIFLVKISNVQYFAVMLDNNIFINRLGLYRLFFKVKSILLINDKKNTETANFRVTSGKSLISEITNTAQRLEPLARSLS